MTHDPLCPEWFEDYCAVCVLIAKVRKDGGGYQRGLDAAREAVASISGQGVFVPRIYKHVALAAIDALREEQK